MNRTVIQLCLAAVMNAAFPHIIIDAAAAFFSDLLGRYF
jgi:hypothetical protein